MEEGGPIVICNRIAESSTLIFRQSMRPYAEQPLWCMLQEVEICATLVGLEDHNQAEYAALILGLEVSITASAAGMCDAKLHSYPPAF